MALDRSGKVSLTDIKTEFPNADVDNSTTQNFRISEYYKGLVEDYDHSGTAGIPESGMIRFSEFRGTSSAETFNYYIDGNSAYESGLELDFSNVSTSANVIVVIANENNADCISVLNDLYDNNINNWQTDGLPRGETTAATPVINVKKIGYLSSQTGATPALTITNVPVNSFIWIMNFGIIMGAGAPGGVGGTGNGGNGGIGGRGIHIIQLPSSSEVFIENWGVISGGVGGGGAGGAGGTPNPSYIPYDPVNDFFDSSHLSVEEAHDISMLFSLEWRYRALEKSYQYVNSNGETVTRHFYKSGTKQYIFCYGINDRTYTKVSETFDEEYTEGYLLDYYNEIYVVEGTDYLVNYMDPNIPGPSYDGLREKLFPDRIDTYTGFPTSNQVTLTYHQPDEESDWTRDYLKNYYDPDTGKYVLPRIIPDTIRGAKRENDPDVLFSVNEIIYKDNGYPLVYAAQATQVYSGLNVFYSDYTDSEINNDNLGSFWYYKKLAKSITHSGLTTTPTSGGNGGKGACIQNYNGGNVTFYGGTGESGGISSGIPELLGSQPDYEFHPAWYYGNGGRGGNGTNIVVTGGSSPTITTNSSLASNGGAGSQTAGFTRGDTGSTGNAIRKEGIDNDNVILVNY